MDIPDKMVPIGIHCRLKWKHKARQCLKGGMLWLFPFYLFFYRTRVRSFAMLVSILTDSLLFSEFDWCDPGVWRCQLKTRWGCFVADVADEDRVGNSWMHTWELKLGNKAKLLFRLWAQGLFKVLILKFRQDFYAGVWSIFCRWCFAEGTKLNLDRDAEARFSQYFEF